MTQSILSSRLAALQPDDWRILRLAGFAATLAHLFVVFRAEPIEIHPMNVVLFLSYVSITAFFCVGQHKYGATGNTCPPTAFTMRAQRGFRAFVLLSLALFAYGGTMDGALFWSGGMVAILFQAVVLWVLTSGPTREGAMATETVVDVDTTDMATTSFASAPAMAGKEATFAA